MTGAGGTGKTQLVLSFLYNHRSSYDVVFWLNAASEETLRASFKACIDALSIPCATEDISTGSIRDAPEVRALLSWLKLRIHTGQQWLVVVDNADDLDWGVRHVIPREGNGTVIITSRDNYAPNMTGHDSLRMSVKAMHRDEAHALLLKACGEHDVHEYGNIAALADELVERLEHLPVAVDLAGAYIRETQGHQDVVSVMRQYLRHYDTNKDRLLKLDAFRGISTYNQTVWTTWDTTLQTIERQYEHCEQRAAVPPVQLLIFLSLFDRIGINHELFELASVGLSQVAPDFLSGSFNLPCWLKRLLVVDDQNHWDDWALTEAMGPLQRYNLVQSTEKGESAYSMHELVRWRASIGTADSSWRTWYTIFLAMLIDQRAPLASRGTLRRRIMPHLPSVSQVEEVLQNVEVFRRASTWRALGLAWYEEGRYAVASEHFVKALRRQPQERQQNLRVELSSLSMLITCYTRLDRLQDAERLAQRRAELLWSHGADFRAEYLTASTVIASLWRHQGRLEAAEQLGQSVVNELESLLGDRHRRTLGAKKGLAMTYTELGRHHMAEKLQLEFYEAQRDRLGENHKSCLAAQSNLAISWFAQGRHEEARELQVRILDIKRAELGDSHPDTAHNLSLLAATLVKLGKYDEAEALEEEAMKIFTDAFGEGHMNALQSRTYLADASID